MACEKACNCFGLGSVESPISEGCFDRSVLSLACVGELALGLLSLGQGNIPSRCLFQFSSSLHCIYAGACSLPHMELAMDIEWL
jgi:hypothetical protein